MTQAPTGRAPSPTTSLVPTTRAPSASTPDAPAHRAPSTSPAPTRRAPSRRRVTPDVVEGTFECVDGVQLYTRRWSPIGSPAAAVAIVHGLGEHIGRYHPLVDGLTTAGFAVHGFDLRGHGRSPGRKGHIDTWSQYRGDVAAYLGHVKRLQAPGSPTFLYGHSLGGAIVLEFGLHGTDGLAGCVVSAPALVPRGVRRPALEALAGAASRVWPTVGFSVPVEDAALSRVPELVEATRRDPLSHRRLSARAVTETLAALAWTRAHAADWRLPLLVVHGKADRIIDPAGSVAFVDAARAGGATDVTLRLYEGVYHEPHNDLDAAFVLTDVVDWLERHRSTEAPASPGPH